MGKRPGRVGGLHLAAVFRWEVAGQCGAAVLEVEQVTLRSQVDRTISFMQTSLHLNSVESKSPSDHFVL